MKRLCETGGGLIKVNFTTLERMHLVWNECVKCRDRVAATVLTQFALHSGSEYKTELNTGYIAGCDNVRLFLLWCLVLCNGVVQVSLS